MSASQEAGKRAIVNTVIRAVGELSGKIATLVLFTVVARRLSHDAVGTFVLAFAFVQIAMILVDLGFDRQIVRRVALDASTMPGLVTNVTAVKFVLLVPVGLATAAAASALGYDEATRLAIYALTGGLFVDSLTRTAHSVLNAQERGGLLSVSVVVQRVTAAALGIGAILAGYGVVAVCIAYGVGALVGLAVTVVLVVRNIGSPWGPLEPSTWVPLLRESGPFALYYSLSFVLTKLDTLILAVFAAQAAVGFYGAASRLYEASFFITFSLSASFLAMYTYLTRESDPTIGAVFERSIKLSLTALLPITVVYAVLGHEVSVLLFGESFDETGDALALLAPSVVLMGVVNLSAALVSLRSGPREIVPLTAGIVVSNIVLNALLAPRWEAEGAAAAMSISLGLFAVTAVRRAIREVGGVSIGRMIAAPLLAAAAMAAVASALGTLAVGLPIGLLVFIATFVAAERVIAPDDLRFVQDMLRRARPVPAR